jgi:DNA-binding response OmpR family regulator
LAHDRPAVAIIDVVLHDMSGVRLAKRALDQGVVPLIITGHHGSGAWLESLGCPFLSKPFRIADLLERVEDLASASADDGHDRAARRALGRVTERHARARTAPDAA